MVSRLRRDEGNRGSITQTSAKRAQFLRAAARLRLGG